MNPLAEKVSGAELEVMKVIWDYKRPVSMPEIRAVLSETTDWDESTIKTLIRRLNAKGVISQEKRNIFYYSPCLSRAEYREYRTKSLIERLYMGQAKSLVSYLVKDNQLTPADLDELRAILDGNAEKK